MLGSETSLGYMRDGEADPLGGNAGTGAAGLFAPSPLLPVPQIQGAQ